MAPLYAWAVAVLLAKPAPAYSVYIAAPRLIFLPSLARLHMLCGPHSLACTTIRGASFSSMCDEADGEWHARIDVSFVPYTYLWLEYFVGKESKILGHERDHLRDIQSDAAEYLRTLSLQTFRSPTDCRVVTQQAGANFDNRLQRFAEQSQRDRQ